MVHATHMQSDRDLPCPGGQFIINLFVSSRAHFVRARQIDMTWGSRPSGLDMINSRPVKRG